MDAYTHVGLRYAENVGHFLLSGSVYIEVDQRLVVFGQEVDKPVKFVVEGCRRFVGDSTLHQGCYRGGLHPFLLLTPKGDGSVQPHSIKPVLDRALPVEAVAGAPQVVEYLLIDVLLHFGVAAGKGNADAVQKTLVLGELGYELVVGHGRGRLRL